MTERPVLFSGPMVRAILAGTKTQTRRVVKSPHAQAFDVAVITADSRHNGLWTWLDSGDVPVGDWFRCPYGVPGHTLWVREAFAFSGPSTIFRADWSDADLSVSDAMRRRYPEIARAYPHSRWKPSIHLPRSDARLFLRVSAVRCERLRDISETDAKAEGMHEFNLGEHGSVFGYDPKGTPGDCVADTARGAFAALWESLNAKRAPWSSNPWVWVVTFERIKP